MWVINYLVIYYFGRSDFGEFFLVVRSGGEVRSVWRLRF